MKEESGKVDDFYGTSKVEIENLYGKGSKEEAEITEPFNPKDVDIITQSMVVANIIERLRDDRILLEPDFQRNPELWDDKKQSRLIESLIVRIPLPSFYFDYDDENDKYIVVDGLQRLWAIRRFAAIGQDDPKRLRLKDLEYLPELNGKKYEDLPMLFQRRIREQTIVAYVIRPGTPENVRTSIFTRINTGGLQLTPPEIKNSVFRGRAAELLKELAHSEEFKKATGHRINPIRMQDCEFVNRFLAFYLLPLEDYRENLEFFLTAVLKTVKEAPAETLEECRAAFLKAMNTAYAVFGDKAFRKIQKNDKYGKINKPLFECVSVRFARLSESECEGLVKKKMIFMAKYENLLKNAEFIDVITNGTAKKISIEKRNKEMDRIIKETLAK